MTKYRRRIRDGYYEVEELDREDDKVYAEVVDEQNSMLETGTEIEIDENYFEEVYEDIL